MRFRGDKHDGERLEGRIIQKGMRKPEYDHYRDCGDNFMGVCMKTYQAVQFILHQLQFYTHAQPFQKAAIVERLEGQIQKSGCPR